MNGYAPFLGQVRLAQIAGRLAIETYDSEKFPVPGAKVKIEFQNGSVDQGVTGANGIFSVPVSPEREGRARITVTPPPGYRIEQSQMIEDVSSDTLVQIPFPMERSSVSQASPVTSVQAGAEPPAIPTWAYVVGGLAAVGLVAYVATR